MNKEDIADPNKIELKVSLSLEWEYFHFTAAWERPNPPKVHKIIIKDFTRTTPAYCSGSKSSYQNQEK
jgi:hypothetical protein